VTTGPARAQFPALGTTAVVAATDPSALPAALAVVRSAVLALDAAASRFRPDSEICRLQAAGGRATRVSPLLMEAVEEALAAAATTAGVLDPTVGTALELLGYDRDFAEVAPTGPVAVRFGRVPGWRAVKVDRGAGTVAVPAGVLLDLGATAKAGCADRAARQAAELTGAGVLVSLGGDVSVGGVPPDQGWVVRVADRHDADADEPAVTVALHDGGLATSGTTARRWARGGQVLHHLVDPATGGPATPCWRTVSVAAPTCLAANVASTAAVILGRGAPDWLHDRGVHGRLVAEDGAVTTVGGWPADVLDPAA
jgi:thiamine biosynthesis lipoprotein